MTMLRMKYGEAASLEFTEQVSREMAMQGWRTGLALAEEKGAAPIMDEEFVVTEAMLSKRPEMVADGIKAGDKVAGKVLWAKGHRLLIDYLFLVRVGGGWRIVSRVFSPVEL